jgi:hypothetical protein
MKTKTPKAPRAPKAPKGMAVAKPKMMPTPSAGKGFPMKLGKSVKFKGG